MILFFFALINSFLMSGKRSALKKSVRVAGSRLTKEEVIRLRNRSNRFGHEWTTAKKQLIEQIAGKTISEASVLIAYHDCLLFLLAYPENRELLDLAQEELQRVAAYATAVF